MRTVNTINVVSVNNMMRKMGVDVAMRIMKVVGVLNMHSVKASTIKGSVTHKVNLTIVTNTSQKVCVIYKIDVKIASASMIVTAAVDTMREVIVVEILDVLIVVDKNI